MKKSYSFLFLLFFLINGVKAQTLQVWPSQLVFGSVDELSVDSQQVWLTNNNAYTVKVFDCLFTKVYGAAAFSVDQQQYTLAPGAAVGIWVRFYPSHNINHNCEMIIRTDGPKGDVRVDLRGQGHYSNVYYDTTENLSEESLKQALKVITGQGYRSLGYSAPFPATSPCARDTMFMIIDNQATNGQGATQNTIECVYTGRQIVGYTDRTQCQNTADPYYNFNTEHTFPQSLFSSLEPMRSDMFHLFPTDETANNKRSNYPFGIVTNPTWSNGGSKFDQNTNTFEPRDIHKGEVARAMFYFVTRYQDYNGFLSGQEQVLRQWHQAFPTTQVERTRCNNIYTYQKNRNPFIDYPQFVDRINSIANFSVAPSNNTFLLPEDTINYGLINGNISNVYRFWIVNDGNQVINVSGLTLTPNTKLTFANNTGVNTIIQPGESAGIDVELNNAALGSFSGYLNFILSGNSLNAPIQIPIRAYVSITGLNENNSGLNTIYPNPVNDEINFNKSLNKAIVQIFNAEGKVVYSNNDFTGNSLNGLSNYPQGKYFISVKENNNTINYSFIKK
ncbi:MAG: endonuclease [Bacteroidota bacterium]